MQRSVLLVAINGGIAIQGLPAPIYAGVPYSCTLRVVGTSANVSLALTGTLPTGITFTDNGDGTATLAGTTSTIAYGSYPITVTATPAGGASVPQSYTLTVPELVLQYAQPVDITFGVPVGPGVAVYASGGSGRLLSR